MRFDAHAGIEREASAVIPGAHGLRVLPLEQTAPAQRMQETQAHLGLYFGDRLWTDGPGFVNALVHWHRAQNAVDHNAVVMHVGSEQGAKAVE